MSNKKKKEDVENSNSKTRIFVSRKKEEKSSNMSNGNQSPCKSDKSMSINKNHRRDASDEVLNKNHTTDSSDEGETGK